MRAAGAGGFTGTEVPWSLQPAGHVQLGLCAKSSMLSEVHAHFASENQSWRCLSVRTVSNASLNLPLTDAWHGLHGSCWFVYVTSSK